MVHRLTRLKYSYGLRGLQLSTLPELRRGAIDQQVAPLEDHYVVPTVRHDDE
jgi:hypothetical protein